ncbi:MAG: hypothetical protein BZ136_09130, partial [Methanosphaera sp. rholeuAM74]
MYRNMKVFCFMMILLALLVGVASISAVDINDTATSTVSDDTATAKVMDDTPIVQTDTQIKTEKENPQIVKEDKTKKEASTITINNDNVDNYFDVDWGEAYLSDSVSSNTVIKFNEQINNVDRWIVNNEDINLTFTSKKGLTVTNQEFLIVEAKSILFENMTLEYDDAFPGLIGINGDSDNARVTINNVEITYTSTQQDNDVHSAIYLKNNSTLNDTTVTADILATSVDWDGFHHGGLPTVVPIIFRGDNNQITNNVFTINQVAGDGSSAPTIYGIEFGGSNNSFTNNMLTLTGENWLYGLHTNNTNNMVITDNIVTVESVNYSAGLYISGVNLNNHQVVNNVINVVAGMEPRNEPSIAENVAYAIALQNHGYTGGMYTPGKGNTSNNLIEGNTLIGNAYNVYGFEQFGGDNTTIISNTISLEGLSPMGIGLIGASGTISSNMVEVTGTSNLTNLTTADYLEARTTGIQILRGSNNTISNNNVNTNIGPAVLVRNDVNSTIL